MIWNQNANAWTGYKELRTKTDQSISDAIGETSTQQWRPQKLARRGQKPDG